MRNGRWAASIDAFRTYDIRDAARAAGTASDWTHHYNMFGRAPRKVVKYQIFQD